MKNTAGGSISVVMPTFNRARALEVNLPRVLALEGVVEIVVVVDGSTDETMEVLEAFRDERLRAIVQEQQGSPAARNRGVTETSGEWILILDDDDSFPVDFASRLRAVATRLDADIVGAPWVDVSADGLEAALTQARRTRLRRMNLRAHPRSFPDGTIETPFLPNNVLVNRRVFDRLRYDRLYKGNAWREETSFFIAAVENGFRVVLTDETFSFQTGKFSGGQHKGRLKYEFWVVVNNWRFLRRHRSWLGSQGHARSILATQVTFVVSRFSSIVTGKVRRRR